jgi:hypothetical protein
MPQIGVERCSDAPNRRRTIWLHVTRVCRGSKGRSPWPGVWGREPTVNHSYRIRTEGPVNHSQRIRTEGPVNLSLPIQHRRVLGTVVPRPVWLDNNDEHPPNYVFGVWYGMVGIDLSSRLLTSAGSQGAEQIADELNHKNPAAVFHLPSSMHV